MIEEENLKKISTNLITGKDFMENLKSNLDMYVKDPQITIKDISEKSGIPFSTINNILYKTPKDLHLSTAISLAKALGVSIDELVGASTVDNKVKECVNLCRSLPEHSLYLIRYFINHQAKIYSNLDKSQIYISVLLPKYENGKIPTTNVVEPTCISHLPYEVIQKAYLGLKIPCDIYVPYYLPDEIVLIAADREPVCGEQCVVTYDGQIHLVTKTLKRKEFKHIAGNGIIKENKIDDIIGYVVGYISQDNKWGIR